MNFASRKHMPSYLHSVTETRSQRVQTKSIKTLLLISSTLMLFGCASQPKPTDQSQTNSALSGASASTATKDKQAATYSHISNDHLADLLTADFTLQREGPNQAFPLFYKLAAESKNNTLSERLLRISAATQNMNNIEKSADLRMSIAPQDQQAYALKFQVLVQTNQAENTADLLEKAIKNKVSLSFLPVYSDDNIRSSEIMSTLSTVIDKLSPAAQENPFVRASLARVLFSQGKYKQSEALSEELLDNQKTRSAPLYLIAAYSQNQLGKFKQAVHTLQTGMTHYPNSPRLLSPLLEFLVQSGQLEKANKAYKNATLKNSERVQAGIHYSNALVASHHPKQALTILNTLPSDHFGLHNQIDYLTATAQFESGQQSQAIKTMERVKGILTNNATNQIALWLYEEGKENDINNIVLNRTHKKHLSEIVNGISHLHEEKGHNELSLELLTKALAKAPNSDVLRYHKAILNDTMGHWQDAVKEMKTLLADKPNNATYLNALGYTLLSRTQKTDEAMTYIKKAYELNKQDPAITDSLGWGYFLQGNLTEATHYLTKAWNLLHDSDIAAHLGESLWQQKQIKQANSIWRKALQGNQSSPLLLNTVKRLNPSLLKSTHIQEKENTQ